MAITVTAEMVASLTAGVRSIFADALVAQGGVYQTVATTLPSSHASETYAWLGETPIMRPFGDERVLRALSEYSYTIRNRKFEATIAIQREVLEDDQLGQIRVRVEAMAEAATQHNDQLLFALLASGETALCYDGKPFYATTHAAGAGRTASNLYNLPLTADNLQTVLTAMQRIPLDSGEPMAVKPTHLLVPPELSFAAKRILNSAYYPESTAGAGAPGAFSANPLNGVLNLVETARITSPTEWHVLDCSHPVKPFILQQRIAPEVRALDGSGGETENTFLRDIYLYGVRSRDNAGFGLWQYAAKSGGGS